MKLAILTLNILSVLASSTYNEIRFEDLTLKFPTNDIIYKNSTFISKNKVADLQDFNSKIYNIVRTACLENSNVKVETCTDLNECLRLIKILKLKEEVLKKVSIQMYENLTVILDNELEPESKIEFADILLQGFAHSHLLKFIYKNDVGFLSLNYEYLRFPMTSEGHKRLYLTEETCELISDMSLEDIEILSLLITLCDFTELHVENFFMTSEFIEFVAHLSNVSSLSVVDRYSDEDFPDNFLLLMNIETLNYYTNNSLSKLCEKVGTLINLKKFRLQFDEECDVSLQFLQKLQKLTFLEIKATNFTEESLEMIFSLKSLEILRLRGYLPFNIVSEFPILENLKELSLKDAGSALSLYLLNIIPKLPNVLKLELPFADLDEGFAKIFADLNLGTLDLQYSRVTKDDFIDISKITTLKSLNIIGSKIGPGNWHCIENLINLEELIFYGDFANNSDWRIFSKLPCLKKLSAKFSTFRCPIFYDLGEFNNLEALDFAGNNCYEEDVLKISKIHSLKFLNIRFASDEDGSKLLGNLTNLKKLTSLEISNLNMDDRSKLIFSKFDNLKELKLESCTFSNDFLQGLTKLTSLTIICEVDVDLEDDDFDSDIFIMPDVQLYDIRFLTKLRHLCLKNVTLDELSLEGISKLEDIETLVFNNCNLSSFNLSFLIQLENLKYVGFNNCIGSPEETELLRNIQDVLIEIY